MMGTFISKRWTGPLALAFAAIFMALQTTQAVDDPPARDVTSIVNGARVKRLTQQLTLTSEQQQKLLSLMTEESKKMAQAQEDLTVDRPERVAKQTAIKADYRKKMEEHLTKEQRDAWAKIDAENDAARKKKRGSSTKTAPKADAPAK